MNTAAIPCSASDLIPLMVMPRGDDFHPRAVAEEIVALAPESVLITPWAGDEHRSNTLLRVRSDSADGHARWRRLPPPCGGGGDRGAGAGIGADHSVGRG